MGRRAVWGVVLLAVALVPALPLGVAQEYI